MRAALAVGLCVVLAPFVLGSFHVNLLSYVGISALVTLGLVLLTGAGGLTSFGQAAFVGLGAYGTALLTTRLDLSPWLGLPAAILSCSVVGLVLGLISLRLSGHYLALITIAWGMAIYLLFGGLELFGAHSGISDIPPLRLPGLSTGLGYYVLIWLVLGLAMLGSANLLGGREGRAVRVLRGGEALAASLGIDAFRLRLMIFVLAAILAGIGGWLYAHLQRYVSPDPFELSGGIIYLLMALVGGAGSVWGCLLGALVITGLDSVLQDVLPLLMPRASNFIGVVNGCLFILLLQTLPGGLAGRLGRWLKPAAYRRGPAAAPPLPKRPLPRPGETLLELQGVSRRFGGLVAVENVGFTVEAGEIVALIGPNGAGKSTLFNLISGLLAPSAGSIRFAGRPIGRTRHLAAAGLARSFQHVRLRPGMSVLENVMLGTYARTRAGALRAMLGLDGVEEARARGEAMAQLARVGLAGRAQEAGGSLPLGHQRLLEIARALAADPCLLLLDEPAAGLRRPEKQALAELLAAIRATGVTVLLVEHDMDFVMGLVDRLVVMNFGRMIQSGTPAEIRASAAVREAYLGAPA